MSDNISTTVSAKAAQLSVQLSQLTKNAFPPSLTCSGGNSSCDMTYYLFFLGDGFQAKGTHQADSVSIAGALSAAMSDPTANQVLLQYASPGCTTINTDALGPYYLGSPTNAMYNGTNYVRNLPPNLSPPPTNVPYDLKAITEDMVKNWLLAVWSGW